MATPKVTMNADGVTLLNTIRMNASQVYQDRIPEATATNIQDVGAGILAYEPAYNEFCAALINRIGLVLIDSRLAWNALAWAKKGELAMGESIEHVFVDLIKAQVYDPREAENTLFKRSLPNVQAVFYKIDSQLHYDITIGPNDLRMAFTSYDNLDRFITRVIESCTNSATQDEYLQSKALIKNYGDKHYFQTVTIPAIVDKDTAEEAQIEIKAMSDALMFMSQNYNSAGVWNSTPKDDQYLLVTPKTNARLNVQVLAAAFNMSNAEFAGHVIVLDDFGGLEDEGYVAFLVDRNWMQIYDVLRTMRTAENGKGLYTNYFYHVWAIYATCRFYNAVAFITGTPTVTQVTVNPKTITLPAGGTVQIDPTVTGTNNPTAKCTYTMTGNTDNESYVTSMGKVVLGSREEGPTITVTAKSVADDEKTATCTITVS